MFNIKDSSRMLPNVQMIVDILPYIQKYYGKTIVIKYGGNAMVEDHLKKSFARDIVLLKFMGINPIIIHGGGPQINSALSKIGKSSIFTHDGIRVTDKETMQVVEWVLCGEIQQNIVTLINLYGGKAVGISGKDGSLIRSHKLLIPNHEFTDQFHDIGQVGDIESIDVTILQTLQNKMFIPVISPVSFDKKGKTYNINGDFVASEIAIKLKAKILIMMTDISGVMDKQGVLLDKLTASEIEQLLSDGTIITGGMVPKISAAFNALKKGVNTVHIIDGRIKNSILLNLLTKHHIGTILKK